MRVLVTGASGFLGREVVRAAVAAGHEVVAMVRPAATVEALGWGDRVAVLRGDLRQAGAWTGELGGVEAVLHLAAGTSGDLPTQLAASVLATENLLAHLPLGSLKRFVHVSSFSVYDYRVPAQTVIREEGRIEAAPEERDPYTITKLLQERMVVDACRDAGAPLIVIRPGAIFGPGHDWDFGRAMRVGPVDLIFAPLARTRLTYVTNCAEAIVAGLSSDAPSGSVFNIVDDDQPTQAGYHRACRRAGARTGVAVPVPWVAVRALGLAARGVDRLFFGGKARLPELLASTRQAARWKPLRYTNAAARAQLGWTPRVSMGDAIDATIAAERAPAGLPRRNAS